MGEGRDLIQMGDVLVDEVMVWLIHMPQMGHYVEAGVKADPLTAPVVEKAEMQRRLRSWKDSDVENPYVRDCRVVGFRRRVSAELVEEGSCREGVTALPGRGYSTWSRRRL
jgi:hypothetical protein